MPPLVETAPGRIRDLEDVEWPVVPPTLVTVHRTSPLDEQSRQIVCRLDGGLRIELLYGQIVTREIPPGPHTLAVHNTLMRKTVPFEALPGGHVHFTVANRAGPGYYVMALLIGVAPLFLTVEPGVP